MRTINIVRARAVAGFAVIAMSLTSTAYAQLGSSERGTSEEEAVSTASRVTSQSIVRGVGQGISNSIKGGAQAGSTAKDGDIFAGVTSQYDENQSIASAGDGSSHYFGAWLGGSYLDLEVRPDGRVNPARQRESDIHAIHGGVDITYNESVIVGLSLGVSGADTDGIDGNVPSTFDQENDDFTIAPYAGFVLSDNWYIDLLAGYTWTDTDNVTVGAAGNIITSSSDVDSTVSGQTGTLYSPARLSWRLHDSMR